MDHLLSLRVFTRIADAGTFVKAAESLKLPPSTVTKLIQDLESHLGVKLLHRTTRRVTVTPEGAVYYERAVRIISVFARTGRRDGDEVPTPKPIAFEAYDIVPIRAPVGGTPPVQGSRLCQGKANTITAEGPEPPKKPETTPEVVATYCLPSTE